MKDYSATLLHLHSINRIYRAKSIANLQILQIWNKGLDIMKTSVIISPSIEQRMIEARQT